MKNSNKNKDHSKFHSWINYPTAKTKKCVTCGCIRHCIYKNSEGKNIVTYEKNNIIYTKFIDCIKF